MPQFDLADEDIKALRVFLTSRTEHKFPAQYQPPGRRARADARRRPPHGRRATTASAATSSRSAAATSARFYEETPTLAPPILNGEGAKVQPDWLFDFLKRPVPIRPWLKVRMPTFGLSRRGDDHGGRVLPGARQRRRSRSSTSTRRSIAGRLRRGRRSRWRRRTTSTASPATSTATRSRRDRRRAGRRTWRWRTHRLNPDWIVTWLRNPQKLQPGTKMPSFYNLDDDAPDGPDDILGGDDDEADPGAARLRADACTRRPKPQAPMAGAQAAQADGASERQM